MKPTLLDVVAVNVKDSTVRLMAENKTREKAEAVVKIAVMRRGCDDEFFSECPAGRFRTGDTWVRDWK